MKTAVTVLQEVLAKCNETAEYVVTPQTGPPNNGQFEYRCRVFDIIVTATSRSKKEAKQKAARQMLRQLSQRGHPVPPPFGKPAAQQKMSTVARAVSPEAISYVTRLKELSEQYHLERLEYEMTSEGDSPKLRTYTVKVRIGHVERSATASTKKMARQLAAEQLYSHLRKNLSGVNRDDDNETPSTATGSENPVGCTETEPVAVDLPTRPDLGMVRSEFHLGLTARLDAPTRERTYAALEQSRSMSPQTGLATVAAALNLDTVYKSMNDSGNSPVFAVELRSCCPDMVFSGPNHKSAADQAMKYLRFTLLPSESEPEGAAESREFRPNESAPTTSCLGCPIHSGAAYLVPDWDRWDDRENTVTGTYTIRPEDLTATTYLEPNWDGQNSGMVLDAHANRPEDTEPPTPTTHFESDRDIIEQKAEADQTIDGDPKDDTTTDSGPKADADLKSANNLKTDTDPEAAKILKATANLNNAEVFIDTADPKPNDLHAIDNLERAKDSDHINGLEVDPKANPEPGPDIEKLKDPKPAVNSEDDIEKI